MRKMGGGKQMKLGILCTMINGFGRRGYYNSQEIGLGRALARKGHEVMIYKGIDPSEKEEKVQVEKNLTIWYLPMKHLGAHGFMDCKYLDPQLKALFCFGDQQIFPASCIQMVQAPPHSLCGLCGNCPQPGLQF